MVWSSNSRPILSGTAGVGNTPTNWGDVSQAEDVWYHGCGALPYIRTITLDPAQRVSGTTEICIHFPLMARRVDIRNASSGTNVPVRVHFGNVNSLYHRSGSTDVVDIAGSAVVISSSLYNTLNRYDEKFTYEGPVPRIFVSLTSTAATGSVEVLAQLTQRLTGSFLMGGIGVNATGSNGTDGHIMPTGYVWDRR